MNSSLSQRMKRLRRAKDRDNDMEPDLEPLKEMYESYTAPWDSSRRVRVGQKVPVCVTRTTSLCDVLWADGRLERDLPMDTFGFELFEDYMQGPTFMPGDLVLPPHSANPVSNEHIPMTRIFVAWNLACSHRMIKADHFVKMQDATLTKCHFFDIETRSPL